MTSLVNEDNFQGQFGDTNGGENFLLFKKLTLMIFISYKSIYHGSHITCIIDNTQLDLQGAYSKLARIFLEKKAVIKSVIFNN